MKLEQWHNVNSNFGFSGVGLDSLNNATELTLVTVCVDKSGSVLSFENDIDKTVVSVVEACRKSPRADNLLLRVVEFNNHIKEVHGFKPLIDCSPNDYSNMLKAHGGTALFDTTLNSIESTVNYAGPLTANDYTVNGLVVVITDGDDNGSKTTPNLVKKQIVDTKTKENLESLLTILVGVNVQSPSIQQYLDTFKNDAGLDQYVNLADASVSNLAKLAQFISKSVTSVSQSLGSGQKSATLTF